MVYKIAKLDFFIGLHTITLPYKKEILKMKILITSDSTCALSREEAKNWSSYSSLKCHCRRN